MIQESIINFTKSQRTTSLFPPRFKLQNKKSKTLVVKMIVTVCSPFSKGMDQNFENFNKRGKPGTKIGVGETKRGRRFSKIKGGTQIFKLNLGIQKNKNEDF